MISGPHIPRFHKALLLGTLLVLFTASAYAAEAASFSTVYGDIAKMIIKKNWNYQTVGAEPNLAVVIEIHIDPSGRITGSRVVTPSGKPDFDNSALRAVAQTETLPPSRIKDLDTLRITFNLQELRK